MPPAPQYNVTGTPGCPNATSPNPAMRRACSDRWQCALPDPATGKYGKLCLPFDAASWPKALQSVARLVEANAPSGVPGMNFMGGIHPRLKRPVGRRLAYAAARLLKGQARQRQRQQGQQGPQGRELSGAGLDFVHGGGGGSDGALTGPTLAGCSAGDGRLTLRFNTTLLGGEGLLLRPVTIKAPPAPAPRPPTRATLRACVGLGECGWSRRVR